MAGPADPRTLIPLTILHVPPPSLHPEARLKTLPRSKPIAQYQKAPGRRVEPKGKAALQLAGVDKGKWQKYA
ncbi:MAG: hypothetical protein WCF20_00065 [Methylovirgula sp.]